MNLEQEDIVKKKVNLKFKDLSNSSDEDSEKKDKHNITIISHNEEENIDL